jgi:large conductance mechanosensitive channel
MEHGVSSSHPAVDRQIIAVPGVTLFPYTYCTPRVDVLVSHAQHEIMTCGSGGPPIGEALMLKQFRDFAMKGNVVDLAIGVIIGAAFGKIVESMVGDIFMPLIGAITGGLDFTNYFTGLSIKVKADTLIEAKKQGAVLAWGTFITVVINFTIIALALFAVVNMIQRMKKKQEEAAPAAPPRQEILLQEIRDLLARK